MTILANRKTSHLRVIMDYDKIRKLITALGEERKLDQLTIAVLKDMQADGLIRVDVADDGTTMTAYTDKGQAVIIEDWLDDWIVRKLLK